MGGRGAGASDLRLEAWQRSGYVRRSYHAAMPSAVTDPRSRTREYDAVVVGSGPNGLAAGITLARSGRSVLVLEARDSPGGGLTTREVVGGGFLHDVFSSVHPFAAASPFFRQLPLAEHGLEWVAPDAPFAHPLDDGTAVMAEVSVARTAAGLGSDGPRYRALMEPLLERWHAIAADILRPMIRIPRHPLALARFGVPALLPAQYLALGLFRNERARALLAGAAAHANMPLHRLATAAPMLVLMLMGHLVNWPFPRGGAGRLAQALAEHLRSLGGEIATGRTVGSLQDLPSSDAVLLDVTPQQFLALCSRDLPPAYRWWLSRYRHGPGVFKLNLSLDGPIPWRSGQVARAGTVHLGGSLAEIAESERAVSRGRISARPYVLLAQPSQFDPSRAPAGGHAVWAYCHVPHGSRVDMTGHILRQVERFAPGARDRIVACHAMDPAELERRNANLVGGDPSAGAQTLFQTFARPVPTPDPYATPLPGVYLCSAATPPGPGVHGMCGYRAARSALRRTFREPEPTPGPLRPNARS